MGNLILEREDNVTTETRWDFAGFKDGGTVHQPRNARTASLENGETSKQMLSLEPQREHSPANALTFAQWN